MNEEIQINIQSDSSVNIETNDKVPQIIVQNYGPTINVTNEIMCRLKMDGEWDNFLQQMYNLSIKLKSDKQSLDPENSIENNEVGKMSKTNDNDMGHVTISIKKGNINYSLKNPTRKKSCWNTFLPQQYLSLFRGLFTALMIGATFALIYGIVKLLETNE